MRFETTCQPCQKRLYANARMARAAAKTIPGRHMTAYRCPATPDVGWHLGHLPLGVVHGAEPKAAYVARVERRRRVP